MQDPAAIDKYITRKLKIRQLRMLVELADRGRVGDVAALMNITQPAVSKMLAEIESGLGLVLFERDGRALRPTVYGECLLRHARQALLGMRAAGEELKTLAAGMAGKVSIGIMSVVAPVLLPQAIARVKQNWPGLNLSLHEGSLDQHLAGLRSGTLDLVVGRLLSERAADDLEEEILFDDRVVIAAAPGHPLARRRKLDWPDLNAQPWIVPFEGAPMRARLESLFAARGLAPPTNLVESTSLLANLPLLHAYPALCLFPQSLARGHEAAGELKILPLPVEQAPLPVGMIRARHRPATPALLTVQESLRAAAAA